MSVWWVAALVTVVAGLLVAAVAARRASRATAELAEDVADLAELGAASQALGHEVADLRRRLADRPASGPAADDR